MRGRVTDLTIEEELNKTYGVDQKRGERKYTTRSNLRHLKRELDLTMEIHKETKQNIGIKSN